MPTTDRDPKAADIILQQLGGARRLTLMIGAKDFFSDDNGKTLVFKFACCEDANYCRITLDPSDTYTVKLQKIGRLSRKTYTCPVTEFRSWSGIYGDQLVSIIERATGLALSL